MSLIPPSRPGTSPSSVLKSIEELITVVKSICRLPFISGRMVKGVEMDGGSNIKVAHGLGRTPQGWITIKRGYGGIESEVSRDEKYLTLYCDNPLTIDIWVF